jgi:hypothetical protein
MYQNAMVKDKKHWYKPTKKYAWKISLVSTRRSFLMLRGGRRRRSASGFSYARVMAAAQSVKQQMMIIKKDERIWGMPKATFVMTGQSSEKLPAGRR